VVEFLANDVIPLLLMTGVGITILLWVLAKYFHSTKLTTANTVGVACVFTSLALVMAGVLPVVGLQRPDEASYFYLFSGVLLFLYSLRLLWPLLSRPHGK
jgi:quinol-cytochrome oxidoreductase complex cytochrome b subunit